MVRSTVASRASSRVPRKLQSLLFCSLAPEEPHQHKSMRKSRLKILPARCLAQLGFLLLYLACPILGEMSRAQPDHGLASSLTLHVLEHCASPPKDPGDGSCSPMPEDAKVMTRNENGHATCSVASHLLNLATKCASDDQPISKQSSEVTTVTLVPRRLLAARSKLPNSAQERIKLLPKRQFRHRSLKRDTVSSRRVSSVIAEQNLVHSQRDSLERNVNVARSSADERRNVRTKVTRTISRTGSDSFRSVTSERLNSRNLNRDAFQSARSSDTNVPVRGDFRRLRRVSHSRVTPSDIRNSQESFEAFADKRRHSRSSAERRVQESRIADHRSRPTDIRRVALAVLSERRMASQTANYETRRFSVERTLLQSELNERRISQSRISPMNSSRDRLYTRTLAERSLSDRGTTEVETGKPLRRFASQSSRTAVKEQLSQTRVMERRIQNDEPKASLTDRRLQERRLSETGIRESRSMSFATRQSINVRRNTSPDGLSFRSLATDRNSGRNTRENVSLQRYSADRRSSESETRAYAEQRRSFLRSAFEGKTSSSRTARENTRRRLSENRRSSSPIRERYVTSRRLLEITGEQRHTLERSQQSLLRRVSEERAASRRRDTEITSRLVRERNTLSGTLRLRRSISLDRSDSNRAYFSRVRRNLSIMSNRRDFFTTAVHSNSDVSRIGNTASRNMLVEMRMPGGSRQQRLNVRRVTQERELPSSEVSEGVRTSRERRIGSLASFSRRARSLEEQPVARRTFSVGHREVRKTRDEDRAIQRLSKARTLMERENNRRVVSDSSFGDRRFILRESSRSSDPLLISRRTGERNRITQDRSVLQKVNFIRRSIERENRRAITYGSTRRETSEGRISREDGFGFLRFRRADSVRNTERRAIARASDMRDSTRALNERNLSRLNRRASLETHVSANGRNERSLSAFRSAKIQEIRVALADSVRHQDTSRRMDQGNHNARAVRVRSMERTSNYRIIGSLSPEREERQNVRVTGRRSQRDDRFNRQLKESSASQLLRRNVRSVAHDAIRRQPSNRQNAIILRDLRNTQGYANGYTRSSEIREGSKFILSGDRRNTIRDSRQLNDRPLSAVRYGRRAADSPRISRNSKSRNYAPLYERREYSNYARYNQKTGLSHDLTQKPRGYEFSAFRKVAVHDNRLIASKTDNYRPPETAAENVTMKTDMAVKVTQEGFNKSSWLKGMTASLSTKWHIGALWQQMFLILATLPWTKTGCIGTISEKVSSCLFAAEDKNIFDATKTAASNDRDTLLGTVFGGGAAAAALLLFSTQTK